MSARTIVVDALVANLPTDWRVIPYDAAPTIDRPTVIVYADQVIPGPTQGYRATTLAVWVLTPKQTKGTDDAESHLDATLAALDTLQALHWSTADFQIYADTYPAYKITATLITDRS